MVYENLSIEDYKSLFEQEEMKIKRAREEIKELFKQYITAHGDYQEGDLVLAEEKWGQYKKQFKAFVGKPTVWAYRTWSIEYPLYPGKKDGGKSLNIKLGNIIRKLPSTINSDAVLEGK